MKYVFNAIIATIVILVIRMAACKNPTPESNGIETAKLHTSNTSGNIMLKKCKNYFSMPKAAVFDKEKGEIYISNIVYDTDSSDTFGYICRASIYGEIVDTLNISDLKQPLGMTINNNSLYIVDKQTIIQFDLNLDSVTNKFQIQDSKQLSDIISLPDDELYACDPLKNCVFHVSKDGSSDIFCSDSLCKTASALCRYEDCIYLTTENSIVKIPLKGKPSTLKKLTFTPSGIKTDFNGGFYVSSTSEGVFWIDKNGNIENIIKKRNNISNEKFDIVERQNMLFLPTGKDNSLEIYELGSTKEK